MNVHANNFRDLAAAEFDTTTLLAHAAEQAIERRYEDFCIVDVDCHHYETEAFNEILQYMEDPSFGTKPSIKARRAAASPRPTGPTRNWADASPAIPAAGSRRSRRRRTATSP
jgi:hypothetical protein